MHQSFWYGSVCAMVLIVGCGGGEGRLPSKAELKKKYGEKYKEAVPVSGTVTVDGSPQAGVNIYVYPSNGTQPATTDAAATPENNGLFGNINIEIEIKPLMKARTDAGGKFCLSTYVNCDGIEAGEYKLAFEYIPKERERGGDEDLLNGKYRDPTKSSFTLAVEKGKPQKDLTYELTKE